MMQGWIEGLQQSIDYIEQHLTDAPDMGEIAKIAALSPFYFQRIFGALCGMTVGEYIRARRMSQAAQELAGTNVRVIDIALKYGYDSPDSFHKGFSALSRHFALQGPGTGRFPALLCSAAHQNHIGGR